MIDFKNNPFQLKPLYVSLPRIDDELKVLDNNVNNGNSLHSNIDELVHKNKIDGKDSYACQFAGCSKVFGKKSRLIVHERIHSGERPFKCHYIGCNKTYTRQFHLTRHVNVSHGAAQISIPDIDEEYQCHVCEKLFANNHSLKKHVKILHSPKRLRCFECGQEFRKQHSLKSHSFIHTGIKPYKCKFENCEYEYVYRAHLKRHSLQHCKNRYACSYAECTVKVDTYKELVEHLSSSHPKCCDVCGKKFDQLAKLRRHLLTHKNIREAYFCPFTPCERYYLDERNLHTHICIKHDENFRGFQCQICDKYLVTKAKLKYHLMTHDPWKAQKKKEFAKKPRKPRKDKGIKKPRNIAKLLSGYHSSDDETRKMCKMAIDIPIASNSS